MTTVVMGYVITALIGYGVGLRVAAHYWRKQARRLAAEFEAKAAELDAQITEAQDH